MTERAESLHAMADRQVTELIELISKTDEEGLRRPCPGREKLGDGTIAALAMHTAENYQRIGAFVEASDRIFARHGATRSDGRQIPRLLRILGHKPPQHDRHGPGAHEDATQYAAMNVGRDDLVERLTSAGEALGRMTELTDDQLDLVPPKDSFRFCDGQRNLEHVLRGILIHQSHQVEALKTALLTGCPRPATNN